MKYISSGIRGYTLHTGRVKEFILLIEWNRGYDFVSYRRRSLFCGVPLYLFDKERKMGIISYIKEEIQVIRERDPAIKSNMEVFLYPSFKVILRYRLAHKLYLKGHYFWARWISQRVCSKDRNRDSSGRNDRKGIIP